MLKQFFTIILLIGVAHLAMAKDLGFRFDGSKCVNEKGVEGLNPKHIGECGDLRGVILGNLDLSGVNFNGSLMDGIDLRGSQLKETSFEGAQMRGALLVGIDFEGAKFKNTNLTDANLSRSKLYFLEMKNVNLTQANLTEADLSFSQFDNAKFDNAIFNKTQLIEAMILNSSGLKSQWTETNLSKTKIAQSDFSESNFEKVKWVSPQIENVQLNNSKFNGGQFSKGTFNKVDIKKSDWNAAFLQDLRLENVNWSGSKFTRVDFGSSQLVGVNLTKAEIRTSLMANIQFRNVNWKGARISSSTKLPFDANKAKDYGIEYILLYEFSGIKQNLNIQELDGWKICHKSIFGESNNNTNNINKIKMDCNGEFVMLACRKKDDNNLILAAYAERDKVFFDTGQNRDKGHIANGVKFYFNPSQSMGFAQKDLTLNKTSCDYQGDKPEFRMCYHTNGGVITRGYRCGNNDLNSARDYERLILTVE